ncbi:hypothetical protein EGR_03711 [Echinococcus granulosus]|uniref:Uncharacterized protein n=1 Tax=Echinococcus granulosus TaxID=6210 RepID=W6UJV9_ECHGR|nr:hypothetical protein EGR_03711 [Echinococcus granulosus]EUB61421.1 hypothetical protein EGR_03711 [Echinococcus granulosus]
MQSEGVEEECGSEQLGPATNQQNSYKQHIFIRMFRHQICQEKPTSIHRSIPSFIRLLNCFPTASLNHFQPISKCLIRREAQFFSIAKYFRNICLMRSLDIHKLNLCEKTILGVDSFINCAFLPVCLQRHYNIKCNKEHIQSNKVLFKPFRCANRVSVETLLALVEGVTAKHTNASESIEGRSCSERSHHNGREELFKVIYSDGLKAMCLELKESPTHSYSILLKSLFYTLVQKQGNLRRRELLTKSVSNMNADSAIASPNAQRICWNSSTALHLNLFNKPKKEQFLTSEKCIIYISLKKRLTLAVYDIKWNIIQTTCVITSNDTADCTHRQILEKKPKNTLNVSILKKPFNPTSEIQISSSYKRQNEDWRRQILVNSVQNYLNKKYETSFELDKSVST